MSISPWSTLVSVTSPNGRIVATIAQAMEIHIGAPTSGALSLSNGLGFSDCNPSMVWSDDSEYLAIPQWTDYGGHRGVIREHGQRLLIVSVRTRQYRYAPWLYHTMELDSFDVGIVRGRDHGVRAPVRFAFDVSSLDWD